MRRRELLGAVPLVLLAACSSSSPAGPTTSAVASTAAPSSPPPSVPASTVPPTTSASPSATRTTPSAVRSTVARTTVPPKPKPTPKPGEPTDPLTGGVVSTGPVIAVKIDNTYFEVPQFGVADADIVFVEQVEGGLTRLICVFHSELDVEVGPIRSVRSTDAELLPVFGEPGLVFSGGAGGPLADLARTDIIDTSGFDGYFRSDAASGTYNLHARLQTVAQLAAARGAKAPKAIGLTFAAADPRVAKGAAANRILATWQAATTEFVFAGGHYARQRDGADVVDFQGRVEAADNVLVLHVLDEPDGTVDSIGSPSYLSHTVGHGAFTLCRDGRSIDGTWSRSAVTAPFVFTDAAHRPLPFKPGHTWVLLVPQTASVATS